MTPATMAPMGRVLVIAGSDPSGGAGIQADIKTITMLGHYAATAITALTVQNTISVTEAHGIEPHLVRAQAEAVLRDVGADAIKTGMLHSADLVSEVVAIIRGEAFSGAVVIDPVMVATSGDKLLDHAAVSLIKSELIPLATLVTPNLPEAQVLTGMPLETDDDMREAGQKILDMGAGAVLMKGGHQNRRTLTDFLITPSRTLSLSVPKVDTRHTHGTGCSFASAFAALLAAGHTLDDAFPVAHAFIQEAIAKAPGFGAGHGPLGHARVGRHDS